MAQQQNPNQKPSIPVTNQTPSNIETDPESRSKSIQSRPTTEIPKTQIGQNHKPAQIIKDVTKRYYTSFMDIARGSTGDRTPLHTSIATTWIIIMLLVFLVIPTSMLVVGSIFFNDCPANDLIPVYLVVGGVVSLLLRIYNVYRRCRTNQDYWADEERRGSTFEVFIISFLVAWFIAGCYFTYSIADEYQTHDEGKNDYCNKILYLYTFWLLLSHFIVGILYVVSAITAAIVLKFIRR